MEVGNYSLSIYSTYTLLFIRLAFFITMPSNTTCILILENLIGTIYASSLLIMGDNSLNFNSKGALNELFDSFNSSVELKIKASRFDISTQRANLKQLSDSLLTPCDHEEGGCCF